MTTPFWKRSVFAAALAAALGGGAVGWRHARPAAGNGPPPLTLPAEVRGRPGRLVVVEAQTPAALVRWHACAGPDRPDLWPTADGKTLLFCTPAPGHYQLVASKSQTGQAHAKTQVHAASTRKVELKLGSAKPKKAKTASRSSCPTRSITIPASALSSSLTISTAISCLM